jgi:hypothetical protein
MALVGAKLAVAGLHTGPGGQHWHWRRCRPGFSYWPNSLFGMERIKNSTGILVMIRSNAQGPAPPVAFCSTLGNFAEFEC